MVKVLCTQRNKQGTKKVTALLGVLPLREQDSSPWATSLDLMLPPEVTHTPTQGGLASQARGRGALRWCPTEQSLLRGREEGVGQVDTPWKKRF